MSHEPLGFDFRAFFKVRAEEMLGPIKNIIAKGEQHIPLLIVYPYDGSDHNPAIMPIAGEFGSSISKEIVAEMQRTFARQIDKVAMVVFVTEVWTVKDDFDDRNYRDGDLSRHPKRKEGLMLSAMHGNEQVMHIYPIDRATNTLGEVEVLDTMAGKGLKLEGRMVVDPPTKQ